MEGYYKKYYRNFQLRIREVRVLVGFGQYEIRFSSRKRLYTNVRSCLIKIYPHVIEVAIESVRSTPISMGGEHRVPLLCVVKRLAAVIRLLEKNRNRPRAESIAIDARFIDEKCRNEDPPHEYNR